MTRKRTRILLPLMAAMLAAQFIVSIALATPASSDDSPQVSPDQAHIKTLNAVLDNMTKDYAKFAKSTPGPQDISDYKIGNLWKRGIDGSGMTIALIEGWDDPKINDVIKTFDQKYGLPDPDIQTIYPSDHGRLPAQCPPGMVALGSYGSCDGWKDELELDVEAAHLVAPYAKILISATPADSESTDDAASQVAPPEMMQAIEHISKNHLADTISISDGTGESTYSYGKAEITAQAPGLLSAAAAGIPVIVATGDCGVAQNLAVASSQCGSITKTPDTAAWDDSPWVTAVGGSVPNFDPSGKRLGSDAVWHKDKYSEGAGYSSVYSRPAYQDEVGSITGSDMRSVPDITMDAQHGTSEAAPLFAGVLALAAQLNQGSIGPINKALYNELGPQGSHAGISNVIGGNNSVTSGNTTLISGFTATSGFNVASGWGTVDASKFVPALVTTMRDQNGHDSLQRQAARALAQLQRNIHLTRTNIDPGGLTYMSAAGFLPQHPVEFDIDSHQVAALTANALGSVSYIVDPSLLKLSAGRHTLTLKSLLFTATANFRSSKSSAPMSSSAVVAGPASGVTPEGGPIASGRVPND